MLKLYLHFSMDKLMPEVSRNPFLPNVSAESSFTIITKSVFTSCTHEVHRAVLKVGLTLVSRQPATAPATLAIRRF